MLIKHSPDVTKIPYISPEAIEKLIDHSWLGNVRELENVIQRALVLQSDNIINHEDIIVDLDPEKIQPGENILNPNDQLRLAAE